MPHTDNTALLSLAQRSALVIETNNLQGGAGGLDAVQHSLFRLLDLLQEQSVPLVALRQIVITHEGLSRDQQQSIQAGRAYPLAFVQISTGTGYYDAKNAGFAATDALCEYVVFADSDCMPAPQWLAALLEPILTNPERAIVSGRTSYREDVFGAALTTIDFKYYPNPAFAQSTRNFYANNVVFRRDIFQQYAYQPMGRTYRGHCQVLGMKLDMAGIAMHYAPAAHTVHRLPDSLAETLQLRWFRGQDTCSLTPHLVKRHLPARWQWFAKTGPIAPLTVLFIRLGVSLHALNRQDLPRLRGLKRLSAYGLICLISAVDMAGALARGLGWKSLPDEASDRVALSYHRS